MCSGHEVALKHVTTLMMLQASCRNETPTHGETNMYLWWRSLHAINFDGWESSLKILSENGNGHAMPLLELTQRMSYDGETTIKCYGCDGR